MSDSNATTPYRIEWKGPEGFGVILDEDGINLSKDGRPVLEQCDLNQLLAVIEEARRVKDANACPVPAPPTPEQRRYYSGAYHAARAKHAVVRALDAEFNPTDAPF